MPHCPCRVGHSVEQDEGHGHILKRGRLYLLCRCRSRVTTQRHAVEVKARFRKAALVEQDVRSQPTEKGSRHMGVRNGRRHMRLEMYQRRLCSLGRH
jgi:hypothetical protein